MSAKRKERRKRKREAGSVEEKTRGDISAWRWVGIWERTEVEKLRAAFYYGVKISLSVY